MGLFAGIVPICLLKLIGGKNMPCLFGHKWEAGKCSKCGISLGKVADNYIQKKNWKKLTELMRNITKGDKYGLISVWEPMALRLFMEPDKAPLEECFEILYEYGDKNTYAFLLGLTHTPKAAAFLKEKLDGTHLGNFYYGHGAAMHDLAAPDAYDVVRQQCDEYGVDHAGPFYYALGAYKKSEDVEKIAQYVRKFVLIGKHSWGFNDELRFGVAGLVEIGGQKAFDALMDIESLLRGNTESKGQIYEHRAVVLYGLLLISRGNKQMTEQLLNVITLDIGQDVYNCYHQYILAQIRGAESRVIDYAVNRLQILMQGPCSRYTGTDCEAVYCLYALGKNGWKDFSSIRTQFEAWLSKEDRFMLTYIDKFFADPENRSAQKELLANSSLQTLIHIESNLHSIKIAYLPRMNQHLGCTILPL